ncbi:MAG TPA: hypothetical protein PK323_14660 [Bacteroidia bacterium]|nr:hypothetical protein [Bacteroidia bacterium]
MKLESKKQKVVAIPHFLGRMLRYTLFCLLLICFSIGVGVLGYYFIGGLNAIDSFHMACMILTGMGPVVEMKTNAAKLFSSLYALYSGVAFLSITAVFFAPVVHRILHIMQVENDAA